MLRIYASIEPKVTVSLPFGSINIIATLSGRMLAASMTRWQKVCLSMVKSTIYDTVEMVPELLVKIDGPTLRLAPANDRIDASTND